MIINYVCGLIGETSIPRGFCPRCVSFVKWGRDGDVKICLRCGLRVKVSEIRIEAPSV